VEGLQICKDFPDHIDLLLTDVVMPLMSGRQLAEKMLLLRPQTKILYMSGYTDDSVVRHGVLEDYAFFLQKPFTPTTLELKIREVLDHPPDSAA
jgi:two-component system cell cycle sensor histidine kinase/response regulator CckA